MFDCKAGLCVISGGARSGKSEFAEELALGSGLDVIYVATSVVFDEEMQRRVEHHKSRRPEEWATVEEQHELAAAIQQHAAPGKLVLVDCLTIWLMNIMFRLGVSEKINDEQEAAIMREVAAAAEAMQSAPCPVIAVTNEVGTGLVPDYPMGRIYRDLSGRMNRAFTAKANEAYVVMMGIPIEIKALDARRRGTDGC